MPDLCGRAASMHRRRWWLWLVWAAVVVVLDQASKVYFDTRLAYGERWHILPFFDFTLLYNPGAAFSFLAQGAGWQRWLLSAIALVAVGVLLVMLRRHAGERVLCAALASILGGALGNLIDRVQLGHVIDFLLVYGQHWVFPAFNLADAAITGGAALLIFDEVRRMQRARKGASATPERKADAADRDGMQGANRRNNRRYCEDLQRRRPPETADERGAVGVAEVPKGTRAGEV